MQGLASFATNLISSLGYGGLTLGLVIDSAGVPIPSEVLLPLAGALVRQGRFNFWLVIVVATLAQAAGAALSYWIGAWGGLPIVERYGKYVLFRRHELEKTHVLFAKYGVWLTLIGRCIPGVRTYIGYPAGVARMSFSRFMVATLVGSLAWTLGLTYLGYDLSGRLNLIDRLIREFGLVALVAAVAGFMWYLYHGRRRGKSS